MTLGPGLLCASAEVCDVDRGSGESISIKLSEYRVLCIHAVEQAISVLR